MNDQEPETFPGAALLVCSGMVVVFGVMAYMIWRMYS
jgi:hypothetical protein